MSYFNFNKVVERRGTASLKYDCARLFGYPEDVLPLWVADMDFPTAPVITEALQERCAHGIFGYSVPQEDYHRSVYAWLKQQHGWEPAGHSILTTPGVVFAICTAIRAYTNTGDAVLIQPPVYYPFADSIEKNGRRVVTNPLVLDEATGRYNINFPQLEAKLRNEQVKLMLLCNPHNPGGRVWTQAELLHIGELCLRHDVLLLSDEIHADFIRPGRKHIPLASLSDRLAQHVITCTSPSKSFNLAGLQLSNIIIENKALRHRFRAAVEATGYMEPTVMGMVACQAAYSRRGKEWLDAVNEYIWKNLDRTRALLGHELPKVRLMEPDGTYLLWLDMRGFGLSDDELNSIIIHQAKLWLDHGTMFGAEGSGFQRVNLACPWETLEEGLHRLISAFKDL